MSTTTIRGGTWHFGGRATATVLALSAALLWGAPGRALADGPAAAQAAPGGKSTSVPQVTAETVLGGTLAKEDLLDLFSHTSTKEDTYSLTDAVKLGIITPIVGAEIKSRGYTSVHEWRYLKYDVFPTADGKWMKMLGVEVGVRVNIKIIDTSAKISTMLEIAASADLKMVETSAEVFVTGLSGEKIDRAQPAPGAIGYANYDQWSKAGATIKDLVHDGGTKVKPSAMWVWP